MNKSDLEQFTSAKRIDVAGKAVYIRKWKLRERLQYFDMIAGVDGENWYKDLYRVMAWVVIRSLCNESGVQLFADAEVDKVENLDGDLLDIVYEESMIYNGLKDRAVKDEIKNSETTRSEDLQ